MTDSFEQLYPVFLTRKLGPAAKASLWRDYRGKWVRWTGRFVSASRNGLTLKHIPGTTTFDVSLWIEPASRTKLARFKAGDPVTYIGRLDSYDDVFRTFYLVHGDVVIPP